MPFDHPLNLGILFVLTAAGYLCGGVELALPVAAGAVIGTYGYDMLRALRGK